MLNKTTLLLLSLTLLFSTTQAVDEPRGLKRIHEEPRIALVVGNANYQHSSPLRNPVNDATDMARVLRERKFQVTLLTDVSQRQMVKAIQSFGRKLKQGGVGLFYYAGHGMQIDGNNYLIPVDAAPQEEHEVPLDSVDVNRVLGHMDIAENRLNLIILDACRDNPFARSFTRSSGLPGLAQMDAPAGTLIAYATAPGSVAADGTGRNGVYTENLLAHIQTPGLTVEQMFKRVRADVSHTTQERQIPWESTSLTGNFYFTPPDPAQLAVADYQPPPAPPQANSLEKEIWELVKDSDQIQDVQDFLRSFPKGSYQKVAEFKLKQLVRNAYEQGENYYKQKNHQEAFKWFQKAAEQGHAMAQYWTGYMYLEGKGVAQDYQKALQWYQKAAQQGDAGAQTSIGYMYVEGKGVAQDYQKALQWYQKAAQQGDAKAQYNIGGMYYKGKGVTQDDQKAFEWFSKAAQQGNAKAQTSIGYMYVEGKGVAQDYQKALEWYQKAAQQGDAMAQTNIGHMYSNGEGVAQDYQKALEWYHQAAQQGDAMAQYWTGYMYLEGKGVTQDHQKALEWYHQAAQQGHAGAQNSIGYMYFNGKGVAQDDQKALEWYHKAAQQGHAMAQTNIGHMYSNGEGVAQDDQKALEWYHKAAQQGFAGAQYKIGVMYSNGEGVAQDHQKAFQWFRKAADQGYAPAKKALEQLFVPPSE